MGVLLQGFFKLPPNNAVPSPADGDPSVPWWWDHLASQANDLRQVGFTAVWLPPTLKAAAGVTSGADGYGAFDDYDIGSKQQKGSIPTRYGSREQLQRCVAVLRANGLDVYLDIVEHQRIGTSNRSSSVILAPMVRLIWAASRRDAFTGWDCLVTGGTQADGSITLNLGNRSIRRNSGIRLPETGRC
jgi:hypothetical protein